MERKKMKLLIEGSQEEQEEMDGGQDRSKR